MSGDDPPYLPVGTDVSAKYKGAFCEAKVSKVVRVLQLKVTYVGSGLGTGTVTDEQIRIIPTGNNQSQSGLLPLRVGQTVQVKHPEKKDYVNATINRIRDCSQYTVVFDDGDITTLRRTALCLKSGRHFNESETLDQLPLTHPEHFGNPVVGGRRGRRSRQLKEDSSDEGEDDDDMELDRSSGSNANAANMGKDVGKVVCVETSEGKRKASRDSNWFPGLVVAPTAQAAVRINTREECLIRSFKDGRYYTVPRKEMTEFKRDGSSSRVDSPPLAEAVDKAINYLDNAELPQHWDKDVLFGLHLGDLDSDENYTDSSDDEPREEKDHFVAQLYKFMDDRGTPLNKGPIICNRDVDLYRFFRIVEKLGGYNSVTNKNRWRAVTARLGFTKNSATTLNLVKQAYFRFLFPFEEFNRKLGCTMVAHPRNVKKNRGRSLIRDKDRATPVQINSPKPEPKTEDSNDTVISEKEKKEEVVEKEEPVKKKVKPPPVKEESIVKIKKEDVTDSSGSEGILDVISDNVQTPTTKKTNQENVASSSQKSAKKQAETSKSNTSTATKRSKVPGEKVKALVEKFEEQSKLEDDEKVQQTRSKSSAAAGSRKDSAISPERKGREAKNSEKQDEVQKSKPSNSTSSGSKPQRSSRPSADEEKKRGRKKKDPEEKTQLSDSSMSDPPSVTVKNVNIGDKLIVYYGPNLESKVTYEAKVLEIERDDAGPIYLVHYTGWNNRYDEWIKPHRIAENISQTSKGKRPSKTSSAKSTNNNQSAGKRGRGASVSSRNTSSENQGPPPNQARSTTPSSVTSTSSRTKSPATPAARAPSARLAKQAESVTKRSTSINNGNQSSSTRQSSTASDSESGNSDSEDSPKRRPVKRKEETPERTLDEESPTERPKRARKTPKKNLVETVTVVATPPNKVAPIVTTTPSTPVEISEPKGRDYDLNQIRSELKGFEKALKLNSPTSTNPPSTIEEIVPKVQLEATPKIVLSTKPPVEEIVKKIEKSPEKEVSKEKEIKEIKPAATDDIYEFKEPEPLELESRAKLNDDKTAKKRRLLEDLDKPIEKVSSPKKKLPRTPPKSDKNDTDKKSRFRRNLSKKSEDSESSSPESKSPAYTEKNIEVPSENTKTRILYASEEAFDKLVISPSFNLKTSITPSKSPVPPEAKIKIEEIDTKLIKSEVIIEEMKIIPEENLMTVDNDIKDSSSLENSDEDDPIHVAIRGIAESKDDEDSGDQLLITQTFTPITKVMEAKKEICLITKDIIETKPVIIPIVPEVKEIKEDVTITSPPSEDIPEKPIVTEQEVEIEVRISPLESEKTVISQLKKEEKVKQISPALQETDSSLLEAAIQPPTTELSNTENIIIPKRTGPRIASSILQKFNAIKKKEENPSPVKSDTTVVSSDEIEDTTKSPIKLFIEEPEVPIKTEIKEEDTITPTSSEVIASQQDFKRRIVSKKNLSREFIDSDETDSDSDSEERLVIARSDDESQTSQPESTTSNAPDNKIIDSVKDTDSNTSALRINTEESSQDSKSKIYSFESTIVETKEEKMDVISSASKTEEEPDSNISLLLCEETIPGSPAPVTESIQVNIPEVRTKPKSAKSLVLEIPFASAPGTSKTLLSEQLKHSGVKVDTKSSSLTPVTVVSTPTVSNIQSSVNTILPANISSANNNGGNISTTLVTNSIKPLITADIVKEDVEDTPLVSAVNSPPTTPESSISNLSPRGENGGSSSGTADESVKSQRGSEASEVEQPFRAVRITKPQHYSEEDTLLNSEAVAVERIKKASPRSINEDSEAAIPTTTVTSSTPVVVTSRKRRKSYKGEDAPANPPVGAKRGRKPNALKNIRNITSSNVPSSTNSDSDDTSESATSANTIPVGPSSGSNTGPEIRLQSSTQHSNNSIQRVSKYNFIVDLDPDMDASQRIALLQQRMAELRKAYSNEKNDLACIERRLKKIRRREREALKAAKQEIACS